MKLINIIPSYYAKTESIKQLIEAADSVIAEEELLNYFQNISIETSLEDIETQIIDMIFVDFYGTRVKQFSLTTDDKKRICGIFAMLEDRKGNLDLLYFIYEHFGWNITVVKESEFIFRIEPKLPLQGTIEEFQELFSRLNPFIERYYIPITFSIVSPLGFGVKFPVFTREVSIDFNYYLYQYLFIHRQFNNYSLLNDDPEEFVDTDIPYIPDFEVNFY